MRFKNFELGGDNLTPYERARFLPNNVVLIAQGTLEDCLPVEDPTPLILLPNSPAQRRYGIGFLKADETYGQGKEVCLDRIESIAGYGTIIDFGDFIRRVKLEVMLARDSSKPHIS